MIVRLLRLDSQDVVKICCKSQLNNSSMESEAKKLEEEGRNLEL